MSAGGLLVAFRSEMFVIRHGRGARVLVILSMALAAGRVALGKLNAVAREVEGATRGAKAAASASAYGPLADGLGAGLAIGMLVLLALSAAAVAQDRDLGVDRIPLTRAVSRTSYLLAKFLSLVLLGLLMAGAVFAAAWTASAAFYDFGPVVEDGYEIFSSAEIRREIAQALGAAVLPLPAVVALGLLISVAARSGTEAVAAALPLVLAFDAMKGLLGKAGSWIFLSYPPTLLDRSCLAEAAKLARGFSDAGYPDRLLWLNLSVPLPEALLLLMVAAWIVERRKM